MPPSSTDLKMWSGIPPLQLRLAEELWTQVDDEWVVWNLLNVKYALTERLMQRQGLTLVHQEEGGANLYRLDSSLPRAFMAHRIRRVSSPEATAGELNDPDFDFSAEAVVIEQGTVGSSLPGGVPGHTPVRTLQVRPGQVLVEVDVARPGLLVVSEVYYPGWRAWVDGEDQPILQTKLAFRGVPLEAGAHRVEMTYEPLSLRAGSFRS